MEQQKFFFKEHSKINLFDTKDESRIDLLNFTKVKLVSTSSIHGFVAIGYKNVIKILNVNELETKTNTKPEHIAEIKIDSSQQITQINLNNLETHLIVLSCGNTNNKNDLDFFVNIYAMETINFDAKNSSQSPVCINSFSLEKDGSLINDLCVSPSEPDIIAFCRNNGTVQVYSQIFEGKTKSLSKQLNAFCICWSPKGKNLAACCKNNQLNLYDQNLDLKSTYDCLSSGLTPTNINWFPKKQFIVSYEDNDKMPVVNCHEIITDKGSKVESHNFIEYQNLIYASNGDEVPQVSSVVLSFINEWNLIVCSYSKSPDVGLLIKKTGTEIYQVLEIEEFRCTLPLTNDNNDMFPVGFAINFNSRNTINFETYGEQQPCPLVLALADTGVLMTFYAINLESSNKSICKVPKKLQFKSIQPALKPSESNTQLSFGTGPIFNLAGSQAPSFMPKPNISQTPLNANLPKQTQPIGQFSFGNASASFVGQPVLHPQINLGQVPEQKPQPPIQNQQISFGFQPQSQSLQQTQQKTSVGPCFKLDNKVPQAPITPFSLPQQQPQTESKPAQEQPTLFQQKQPVIFQKEPQIAPTQAKNIETITDQSDNCIEEFCKELEELKGNVVKLFNGKDLSKHLLNISVIKETKKLDEVYKKLNEEMKTLNEDCSSLRALIFTDFHNLEKLRVIKHNIEEKKGLNLINQFDQDPYTKSRYENVKKLYAYMLREVPNLRNYIETQRKRKQERLSNIIPFEGIYEGIKIIDMNITQNNKKIAKLVEQIKFAKLGRNILHDYRLNMPRSLESQSSQTSDSTENKENFYPGLITSKNKEQLGDLNKKMSDLVIECSVESEEQIKKTCEKNSKFYAQLYDVLRKRKQIPSQTANFDRLELLRKKYDESRTTLVVLNDTSFLHAAFSPNVSQIQQALPQSQPSTPVQIQKLPTVQVQPSQPSLQNQNQQKQALVNFAQQQPALTQTKPPAINFQQTAQPLQIQQQQQPQSILLQKQPLIPAPASTSTPAQAAPVSFSISNMVKPTLTQTTTQSAQQQPSSIPKQLFPTETKPAQQEPVKPSAESKPSTPNPSIFENMNKPTDETKPAEEKPKPVLTQTLGSTISFGKPTLGGISTSTSSFSLIGAKPQEPPKQQTSSLTSLLNQPSVQLTTQAQKAPEQKAPEQAKPAQETENKAPVKPLMEEPAKVAINQPKEQAKEIIPVSTIVKPTEPAKQENLFGIKPKESLFGSQALSSSGFSFLSTSSASSSSGSQMKPVFSFGNLSTVSKESTSVTPTAQTPASSSLTPIPTLTPSTSEAPKPIVEVSKPATVTSTIQSTETPKVEPPKPVPVPIPAPTTTPAPAPAPTFSFQTTNQPTTTSTTPATTSSTEAQKPAPSTFSFAPTTTTPAAQPAALSSTTSTTTPSLFGSTLSTQPGLFGFGKTTPAPGGTTTTATNTTISSSSSTTITVATSGLQGTSTFSKFLPTTTASGTPSVNPFSAAIASASSAKPATADDADMDSTMNSGNNASSLASGFSFGFGLGSSKPASSEPPKNIFGGSSFTTQASSIQPAQTPKSPFGSVLKTATFSAQPATSLFGSSTSTTTAAATPTWGSSAAPASTAGSLFSSFSTPQKPSFGAAPAFGTASAFGSAPTFGSPAFGGSSTTASGTGGFGAAPTFGSGSGSVFGSAATQNQPTFGSIASGSTPTFGSFGQNSSNTQTGFGALAQQNQQGSLFSSFGNNQNTGGFTSPNSSSFTTYRK